MHGEGYIAQYISNARRAAASMDAGDARRQVFEQLDPPRKGETDGITPLDRVDHDRSIGQRDHLEGASSIRGIFLIVLLQKAPMTSCMRPAARTRDRRDERQCTLLQATTGIGGRISTGW